MSGPCRRRTVVRTAGIVLAGALAGCGGGESDGDETEEPTDTTAPPETTPTTTSQNGTGQPSIDEFLSGTSNYDEIEEKTGTDAVEVQVGTEANGAYYGFSPPAIRIDQGTTVTWTWIGQGGVHNVSAQHGADFRSKQTSETGFTFEYTFDETGTVLYQCDPHSGLGMKGAVVVE